MRCVFDFRDFNGTESSRIVLAQPTHVIRAHTLAEVRPALRAVEKASQAGMYAAGFVAYEAAAAFDSAFKTVAPTAAPHAYMAGLPLLCFGIFTQAAKIPATAQPDATEQYRVSPWTMQTGRAPYTRDIETLRAAIAQGDCYQVNYTIRNEARFEGDDFAYYEQLRQAQQCGYGAYLDLGHYRLLSLSPELFFQRSGNLLTTRPMKGTAARGRWAEEDAALAQALQQSAKNRAENIMIVDLLRNDLARLAQHTAEGEAVSRILTTSLFEIESYPTVHQMTSTVSAELNQRTTLDDIFAALFPSGSITGAPKIKAMEWIAALEQSPRGAYCGAVGIIHPGGNACFNVAIRTLTHDRISKTISCGLGGGITWGSEADDEYAEVLTKALFLTSAAARFELIETLLYQNNNYWLLERHLVRLTGSARYFGFTFNQDSLATSLSKYALGLEPNIAQRVRLLLARDGSISITSVPAPESPPLAKVALALEPVSSTNQFLYHKTTQRQIYEQHSNAQPEYFDVLMWNENGEVTEFTRGNIVAEFSGQRYTPPLSSGVLNGTLRSELLAREEIHERIINRHEMMHADAIWFINSVRGWVQVRLSVPSTVEQQYSSTTLS